MLENFRDQGLRPGPQRSTDLKTQGVSVRPTRKPRVLSRLLPKSLLRSAERRTSGLLNQEPPRTTLRLQLPVVHALPSAGGFPLISFPQSLVPSHPLPRPCLITPTL